MFLSHFHEDILNDLDVHGNINIITTYWWTHSSMFNIFNSNSLKRLHSNYSESMDKLNITTKEMDLVVTKIVLRKDYL